MAVLFLSGAETGDFSQFAATVGTISVITTTVRTGNYAISTATAGSTAPYNFTAGATTFHRGYVNLSGLAANMLINQMAIMFCSQSSAGGTILRVSVTTDGSGNPSLNLYNAVAAAQVGSAFAVPANAWILVEVKLVISATVGVAELKVNGVVAATGSNLNTGTNNCGGGSVGFNNSAGTGTPAGTIVWDDIFINSTAYIGSGGNLARQFNATAPNYNTFTFVGGANVQSVWDNTPFTTGTNATDAVSTGKQTGVVNFSNATDTGATGHGPQFVSSGDTINGAVIGAVAKTGTASDAADSTIFRTPAGGGGVDTITAFAAGWATTDGYKETILGTTPTTAQILNCEAGIQHNATTNTHTYEDVWLIIDVFSPITPLPLIARRQRHRVLHVRAKHPIGKRRLPLPSPALAIPARHPGQKKRTPHIRPKRRVKERLLYDPRVPPQYFPPNLRRRQQSKRTPHVKAKKPLKERIALSPQPQSALPHGGVRRKQVVRARHQRPKVLLKLPRQRQKPLPLPIFARRRIQPKIRARKGWILMFYGQAGVPPPPTTFRNNPLISSLGKTMNRQ